MMALAIPDSSSIERKMKPLAVPGRCLAMMHPAVRTGFPSPQFLSSAPCVESGLWRGAGGATASAES